MTRGPSLVDFMREFKTKLQAPNLTGGLAAMWLVRLWLRLAVVGLCFGGMESRYLEYKPPVSRLQVPHSRSQKVGTLVSSCP